MRSYTDVKLMGETIERMSNERIKYFIVMALDDLIPVSVVNRFPARLYNAHSSLLPDFLEVGDPVKEQLKQGVSYGGVTFQYVGEKRDRGHVLVRYKVKLIYDGQPKELRSPPRNLVYRNYDEVIIPTAAKVCAFALRNLNRIKPTPLEQLVGGNICLLK